MQKRLMTVCLLSIVIAGHLVLSQEASAYMKDHSEPIRKFRQPDGFENFFIKASKSVPRIGRRNKAENGVIEGDTEMYKQTMPIPKLIKRFDNGLRDINWNDLADKVEYYPEILLSPNLWSDGGNDWEYRMKRSKSAQHLKSKEFAEYN